MAVCGIGVNDADYNVVRYRNYYDENGKRIKSKEWECPFYRRWQNMLTRCYSPSSLKKYPTYTDCIVCDEWLVFSNFKAWMEKQDWEGKHLDKDLLVKGNKQYCPSTCVFIDSKINTFLQMPRRTNGLPDGVSNHSAGKYQVHCNDPFTGKRIYIGLYDSIEDAHLAWQASKRNHAIALAEAETDDRIKQALLNRY